MHNIKLLGDRVLLKRMDAITKSAGGLFIPDATQYRSNQAVVAAVGPGLVTELGVTLTPTVSVGDHVMGAAHAGQEIALNGEEFWLVRECDIMYVVEHPEDQ